MKIQTTSLFSIANGAFAFSPNSLSSRTIMPPTQSTQLYGEYGASSTSFYTTTEKKDSYESLDDVLTVKCKDANTREVIRDMLDVCAEITEALRTGLVTVEGSMNDFGDAQLSVDVSWEQSMVLLVLLLRGDECQCVRYTY
jgi:hypothetical protein